MEAKSVHVNVASVAYEGKYQADPVDYAVCANSKLLTLIYKSFVLWVCIRVTVQIYL